MNCGRLCVADTFQGSKPVKEVHRVFECYRCVQQVPALRSSLDFCGKLAERQKQMEKLQVPNTGVFITPEIIIVPGLTVSIHPFIASRMGKFNRHHNPVVLLDFAAKVFLPPRKEASSLSCMVPDPAIQRVAVLVQVGNVPLGQACLAKGVNAFAKGMHCGSRHYTHFACGFDAFKL